MGKFTDAIRKEAGSYDDTEWRGHLGGTEVVLFSQPVTSLDMTVISKRHPGFQMSPTMEGMVDMLIRKARDDDDNAAFTKADKPYLMRLDSNKVGDIFGALFGEQIEVFNESDEDFEERVKN